jgi:hypothetical protein
MVYVYVEDHGCGNWLVRVSCVDAEEVTYDTLESESFVMQGFKTEVAASIRANIVANVLLNGGTRVIRG